MTRSMASAMTRMIMGAIDDNDTGGDDGGGDDEDENESDNEGVTGLYKRGLT
jgi:hypothetical protein